MCCRGLKGLHRFFFDKFSENTINSIWTCILEAVFYWLMHLTASYIFAMTYSGYNQSLVICYLFLIRSRKEKIHILYVARVINSSVFLELLWRFNLVVCYKLSRFWPPWVEPVWYLGTIVWRIQQVCTVRWNGIYI